ncbi:hypothetical protein TCSYLVIO_006791 [Trypanosoma cruzi]|nr:hypothetical protein TCSYLVIO_006791 [Trypanosoma cruzi]
MYTALGGGSALREPNNVVTHSNAGTRSIVEGNGKSTLRLPYNKENEATAETSDFSLQGTMLKTLMKGEEEGEKAGEREREREEEGEQGQRSLGENVFAGSSNRSALSDSLFQTNFRKRIKISWKCGMCGYHVLAMDQNGKPLPLSVSSFGQVLPMSCPRCQLEHTSWEQAVPFDEYGDHANIRSKLSNNYVRTASNVGGTDVEDFRSTATKRATGVGVESPEIPPILQEIGCWRQKEGGGQRVAQNDPRFCGPRMAYYCGKCGRKLLRIDPYGELVPMVRDKDGTVLPIVCPGCKVEHSQWDVKPFTVTL